MIQKCLKIIVVLMLLVGMPGLTVQRVHAAPDDLAAGDIAIILYNSDNPDELAFVALADIAAGEVIYFTDNGWKADNTFRANEGIIQWTAPTGGVAAGTIVQRADPFNSGDWSTINGSFALSASGDQLLAYQGSDTSPSFIYALNNEGAAVWQADADSSNTSALPLGLVNGTSAVALDEGDNAVLNCTSQQTGTKAQLLSYISNPANWTLHNTTRQSLDSGCSFSVTTVDIPPTVQATTPADSAVDISPAADVQIVFSEDVTVSTGWADITCTSSGGHTFNESGGPQTFTLNPDADFTFGETCTVTVDKDLVADQDGTVDNMAADYVFSFDVVDCGTGYTPIHQIQGSGTTIALTGTQTVEGVVTMVAPDMGGFFIQSLDADWDTDDATSEGLFVYDPGLAGTLSAGDHLRLTGNASDYTSSSYGQMVKMSQLNSITTSAVCAVGVSATPAALNLPITGDPATYLERYEGMLVTIPQTLTVQQNYFQGRFGQITLGSDGRIFTQENGMGGTFEGNLQRLIVLDDGSHGQNPNPIPYYAADGALRAGDTLTGLTGVVDQGWINSSRPWVADQVFPNAYYRVHPTTAPAFTSANPRPAVPPSLTGTLKVAAFNVLNYFTTIDEEPYPSGSPYDDSTDPRGADSTTELTRQQDKLVSALAALDADIIGLIEIEAWDGADAINTLLLDLNTALGGGTYAAAADPFDTAYDVIQQAFIYDTAAVTAIGSPEILTVDPFDNYRPALAQLFEDNVSGEQFWVVVNHFKSKSCYGGESGGDEDGGPGIGCYNGTRIAMASATLDWISSTLSPVDPDVIITGDLNCYGGEDPIDTLVAGGMIDQAAAHVPESSRYSYVFDGMAGYLDHALTTSSLDWAVKGVAFWHISTDEPSVIDYNEEYKTVDLYQDHPYRASDHDPIIISLDFTGLSYFLPLVLN